MSMEPVRLWCFMVEYAQRMPDVTKMPPDKPEGPQGQDLHGRVLPFRRRGSLFTRPTPRPSTPVEDLSRFERTDGEDDYRHRMLMNTLAAGVTILLIAGGIWLANSLAQLRKDQDCVMSGRRNCNPPVAVEPPPKP
jgi:hypothetical protein